MKLVILRYHLSGNLKGKAFFFPEENNTKAGQLICGLLRKLMQNMDQSIKCLDNIENWSMKGKTIFLRNCKNDFKSWS